MAELDIILFESQDEWEQWLDANHDKSEGVFVKIAKKKSGKTSVTYPEALDVALCFGWIDSQKKGIDDTYWMQRFTARRKKSPWSQVNREKVENLIAQGKMRPSGLQEIENAKADGRWDNAYAPQSKATIPDDLQSALDANPKAHDFFKTLNSSNRYAIIYQVTSAKKAETRQRRITKYIDMLSEHKKLY